MLCRYYVIESTASHGIWIVAAEDDEQALASLPDENRPYEVIWKTEAMEREAPLAARLNVHPEEATRDK